MIMGLCGAPQSGKGSVAEWLVKHHGYTRFAFADALKAVAYDCNPWLPVVAGELAHLGMTAATVAPLRGLIDRLGPDGAKQVQAVREFYQDLGVAVREHVGDDAWVDAVMWQALQASPAVVSDVRFKNEADAISAKGGYIIRVVRPGVCAVNDHVSEHALDDYPTDGTIWNDGTLDDIGGRVESVLTELGIL